MAEEELQTPSGDEEEKQDGGEQGRAGQGGATAA